MLSVAGPALRSLRAWAGPGRRRNARDDDRGVGSLFPIDGASRRLTRPQGPIGA